MDIWNNLKNLKVTIMGLGLNGGGVATASFFARRGAKVTVTDTASPQVLEPSVQALSPWPNIRFVLGRHDPKDFSDADLVIKNPGVRGKNPFLDLAKRVETDISIFLQCSSNPLLAVTGSKGKSTTVTALHHILKSKWSAATLGGNITLSPLNFLENLDGKSPVVLELSSWQLGDLSNNPVLHPKIAAVTNILYDHMNTYATQRDYALDKAQICRQQTSQDWLVLNGEDSFVSLFQEASKAQVVKIYPSGRPEITPPHPIAWLEGNQGYFQIQDQRIEILPPALVISGRPFRLNCLFAGVMAHLYGMGGTEIQQALALFRGVEHRMEPFLDWKGIRFINDTAATIPEASCESYRTLEGSLVWITGGTDKSLLMDSYQNLSTPPRILCLLAGSATDRIIPILKEKGWSWMGPYESMKTLMQELFPLLQKGDTVLLSPGATSKQHFTNEFQRGNQFKDYARSLSQGDPL